ncbi:ceroid-lipofuscinosis neuronal protein 5 [Thecamonas trahens ATCC 50062]|uniref:Ceroid-lipofuscinosis neuronal protein 5 n=1 Tax=Thecamonas trahens ATCC 50062 TaxID=461836 RepID=A0A0L0D757_THETB|nr:ceroid-lipofuscinosis neuronal protein 5 [Thecamonas trahens ATCC 50062]KNC48040.1 ceroid-lipofuscinosis neuronal protein 5 [Thecamonas trahens ATCC 50062]|eukprot:XP_013759055.1 ceroid-lipofuscinosis neuronal protein 5 [Thecamonas trahens ATCC 50062]
MHTVAAVAVVAIVASVLCVSVTARPTPPAFCQDPPSLHFCSVLPGQGVPLPAPISDDDTVDVWVLQAPVWEFIPLLGNITKELKLIHTAIGLVVNSTGAEYSFEAEGLFESPNASFPYIVTNASAPNGKELIQCDAGGVCWDAGIDWDYYTEDKIKLGTINGTVFNKLMKWIPMDNDTYSITYETFRVMSEWDNGDGKVYFESYTCDDYAWRVLGLLKTWGADFADVAPARVYLNFYVGDNAPTKVDQNDPASMAKVIDYFEQYNILERGNECAKSKTVVDKAVCAFEVLEKTFEWLENSKYIIYFGEIYWLDQVPNAEGLSFDWKYVPTPITPVAA